MMNKRRRDSEILSFCERFPERSRRVASTCGPSFRRSSAPSRQQRWRSWRSGCSGRWRQQLAVQQFAGPVAHLQRRRLHPGWPFCSILSKIESITGFPPKRMCPEEFWEAPRCIKRVILDAIVFDRTSLRGASSSGVLNGRSPSHLYHGIQPRLGSLMG